MKKYLIIIIVGLLSCNCINKNKKVVQENNSIKSYHPLKYFKGDSLQYIEHNFINENNEFTGKTINTFLDKLEISPKKFLVAIGGSPYTTYIAVSIQFFNDFEIEKKIEIKKNPMIMNLYFETPVNTQRLVGLLNKTKNNWNEELFREYLGQEKIKDIKLVNYGF